jgi:hypothetical protein
MATLTKQRRGLLNNTINREIKDRERKQFERLEAELGVRSHFMTINPVYLEWERDKERGQWCPQNFNSKLVNTIVKSNDHTFDREFATEFVDAMDELHSKMCSWKRITNSEYEYRYSHLFSASYNIGRFYFEWEESMFGITPLVEKWKNS